LWFYCKKNYQKTGLLNLLQKYNEHNYSHINIYFPFTNLKNRGWLNKCLDSILKIVRFVKKQLIELTDNFVSLMILFTTKITVYTKNYVYNFNIFVNESFGFLESHNLELILLICKQYLKVKLHHVARLERKLIVSKYHFLKKKMVLLFNNLNILLILIKYKLTNVFDYLN
jgi:hypothetical protein